MFFQAIVKSHFIEESIVFTAIYFVQIHHRYYRCHFNLNQPRSHIPKRVVITTMHTLTKIINTYDFYLNLCLNMLQFDLYARHGAVNLCYSSPVVIVVVRSQQAFPRHLSKYQTANPIPIDAAASL